MLALGNSLNLGLSIDRAQEYYFQCLRSQILPRCLQQIQKIQAGEALDSSHPEVRYLRQLLELGHQLKTDVNGWLNALS
ncbi:hypothetical protein BST81_01950 [Leptolyngbya sp. 'hensonii']|uniref:hypothetical protein n=1 Tax=Leptolyngbya sp. 'hensonii' TaxID=1922337 RepID=UPI00094FFF04|nr:hypothetical protein [Leptolyngbya sp. 'hensonii']OLP20215.1 hypothetical protein BST81_01950 [Leptolyngbya sp. 'hensonii']